MDKCCYWFCGGAAAVSLAVFVIGFPLAALSASTVAQAGKAMPAEALGSVHVGGGFGNVPVTKLMDYYISHPPKVLPVATTPAAPKLQFGGC